MKQTGTVFELHSTVALNKLFIFCIALEYATWL